MRLLRILLAAAALVLLAFSPGLAVTLIVVLVGTFRKRPAERSAPLQETPRPALPRKAQPARPPHRPDRAARFAHLARAEEEFDSFTEDFQRYYYEAKDKGREIYPWELPPERAPWER